MPNTHLLLDHIFIAIILVSAVIEWRWLWPGLLRAIASGVPGARLRYYRVAIIAEWLSMACILVAWMVQGRSWAVFRLGDAPPLRLGLGLLFVSALTWLLWNQRRAVFARPDTIEKVRQKIGFLEPLLPHTAAEHRAFMLVSLTAGICEEIIFRGFVMWYFTVWTGPVMAAILSSLVFGFAHMYQGLANAPRTALAGAVFAFLTLGTGSLWPAIILHAVLDIHSGDLGYRILSRAPGSVEPAAA